MGHPLLGYAGSLITLCLCLSLVTFAVAFSSTAFWCILAAMGLYLTFWTFEYFYVRKIGINPEKGGSFLARFFWPVFAFGCLAALTSLAILFVSVGSLRLNGSGMSPTVLAGELIAYRKASSPSELKAGQLILFQTSGTGWGPQTYTFLARVLAVPGDRISTNGTHYFVNGRESKPVGTLGTAKQTIRVPAQPDGLVVPADCFFVVQDDPKAFDSQTINWAKRNLVIGTRILLFGQRGIAKEIK